MRAFLFAAVLALSQQALACGYCVEDKMAAVYDHATVTRALAQKHHVAFFHIEGGVPPGAETKRAIEGLANSASGVDRGTARVSPESSSLSLAFDPQRTTVASLQAALERKLAEKKHSLMLLQVMDRPADFSPTVARSLGMR